MALLANLPRGGQPDVRSARELELWLLSVARQPSTSLLAPFMILLLHEIHHVLI